MFKIIKERIHQKFQTLNYPKVLPELSNRFLGRPHIIANNCGSCNVCAMVCPCNAIKLLDNGPVLDMGLCIFCGACKRICPYKNISFSQDYRLATLNRNDLLVYPVNTSMAETKPHIKHNKNNKLFRKSFRLRQVSAAGCNACEADCNVLTTLKFDLAQFGIDFVASPRHADAILVTGPVGNNMLSALHDTITATPDPRLLIAVGSCAISGGLFKDTPFCHNGLANSSPAEKIDLYVPGCPPNPWTILDGLLRLIGYAY